MIANPNPGLTFGPLNLIGTDAEQAAQGYKFEALAETDFGNPVPIFQKVVSWLQDGALVSKAGDDNRDGMNLPIRIVGNDSNKLALGEQALMLQTGIRNTLTWTPPDGLGQPCVFDVVMSNLDYDFDDITELYTERIYTLRLQCLPFTRTANPVTVTIPAPSGSQTLTTVDACTSFTNWAGTAPGGAGTVTTGVAGATAVFVTNTNNPAGLGSPFTLRLVRSSLSASLTTTPYIRVDMSLATTGPVSKVGSSNNPVFTLTGNAGTAVVPIASQSGNVYWLDTTGLGLGTTLTSIRAESPQLAVSFATSNSATLSIADISRSNVIGEPGTRRQLARTVPVAGSARTQGSLAVADSANALGTVLLYTCPAVAGIAQPNLRQFLSSGNTTSVDATNVSGLTSDLNIAHSFDIPITSLETGTYAVFARVKHASGGAKNINWQTGAIVGGNLSVGSSGTMSVTVSAGVWQIVDVAEIELPTRMVGTAGLVRVRLDGTSGLLLDEAWLFNKDTGNLTWVECGTGSPAAGTVNQNRLWVDAATLDAEVPTIWTGFAADRTDQWFADAVFSNDVHNIAPTAINVFTVTTNSTASSLSLTHYPRFMTHVAA